MIWIRVLLLLLRLQKSSYLGNILLYMTIQQYWGLLINVLKSQLEAIIQEKSLLNLTSDFTPHIPILA